MEPKLGSRKHTPRAKQEDVDIETLTQPQAFDVTNLGRKNERERGSQGRKPTCKTLSQIRCEVMKDKVDQGGTQRAYVHALSDSGSHIREKERRPGRTPKRLSTTEISMRSDLHTPFRQIPGQRSPVFVFLWYKSIEIPALHWSVAALRLNGR